MKENYDDLYEKTVINALHRMQELYFRARLSNSARENIEHIIIFYNKYYMVLRKKSFRLRFFKYFKNFSLFLYKLKMKLKS